MIKEEGFVMCFLMVSDSGQAPEVIRSLFAEVLDKGKMTRWSYERMDVVLTQNEARVKEEREAVKEGRVPDYFRCPPLQDVPVVSRAIIFMYPGLSGGYIFTKLLREKNPDARICCVWNANECAPLKEKLLAIGVDYMSLSEEKTKRKEDIAKIRHTVLTLADEPVPAAAEAEAVVV